MLSKCGTSRIYNINVGILIHPLLPHCTIEIIYPRFFVFMSKKRKSSRGKPTATVTLPRP